MVSKKFLLGICLFLVTKIGYSQSTLDKFPSLSLGSGVLIYYGNIGQNTGGQLNSQISAYSRIRTGYNLSLEQKLGKIFSLTATGLYGQLGQSERSSIPANNVNFQSSIYQGDLSLIIRTDKLFPNSMVTPYIGFGAGYLAFDPYTDLHASNGDKYYYWPGGAIMNEPYTAANLNTATPLERSYKYSTKMDSLNKYAKSSIIVPLTFGFNFKFTDNLSATLGATYFLTFTNAIDNANTGKNDSYLYTNVSLKWSFGHADRGPDNKQYNSVDFSKIEDGDSDGDGIKDSKDKCPGTPKGVKVDADGCPLDSDGDGIPDYLDKEPNSKKGAMVDANGVTQTDEMLARKQAEWDAGAVERSQAFNANPSQETISKIEKTALENKKESGTSKALPAEFQAADYNKDGFIEADEINKVIDGFFSGDNDFTVEKINRLIDFFFEQ